MKANKKVVIIMGSHKSNGNSGWIVEELASRFSVEDCDVDVLDINKLKISHCIDCDYCRQNYGKCVYEDDMNTVYPLMRTADSMIIVSPVYFNNVTSKLKVLIDRCQMIFMCDFAHQKPFVTGVNSNDKFGFLISLGGANAYENQFVGSELTVGLLYRNLRMPLTGHFKYAGLDHDHMEDRTTVFNEDMDLLVRKVLMR
ncbi:MAG: flavodoxin family protein [Bacillota bacterium]|nr:flavodoxin family protein [Bacillota bacterium]